MAASCSKLVLLACCLLILVAAASTAAGHGVQPLSRIAIHRARVALEASAAVWASPELLGSKPTLIAVSNKIAFANPKAPVYPRLAQGKSWNEMTVTWTSGYDINEAYPFVEWGMKWSPAVRTAAGTVTFDRESICERDGSNEYSNYQPGSLNTTDTLIKDLDNIDIVFHIGDISYANGYISQWDQFTQQVEEITSRVPYMIASGNHERDWPNTGSFYNGTDSGGECGVLAETMYYTPTENRANYWYSTDYGMFRFCIADSEHDWREGTEQYKFIENCLATVDRKKQPWLIFMAHRVLGYSSDFFYAQSGLFQEPMGRESLQKLWQKYRVDLAFYGHVHNYERTCPIYEKQCVSSEKSHYTGTMNGTIHVVVGGGGSHLSNFSVEVPAWSVYREMDYGFVKLTAFNYSSLLYEYKRSSDGKVYDSFTVHREYRDVLACVKDSCPPITPRA
ncbi:hypothetical protein PR202_ga28615 [Eleusine coracana subsp. coracana]|uniref:Purple acid phosphatase n=1 Tax=Eleusine coracana subsp. coracana TaxID=191504 RepID=A0AAV5DJA7_ELECO|nr:hypothetical protein PR202_ga28615 [Eleusine coracana subsp. coracana]